jgi:5-methylthioadenosine/S-adenosylhomocysteine deaminase
MGILLKNLQPVFGSGGSRDLGIESSQFVDLERRASGARPGDVVIDAGGKLAFPGFVNAHTHLAMVIFRGLADDVPLHTWLEDYVWPIERKLTPEDVYWCTLLALAEAIRGGTTCIVDMYFHTDEVAQAVEESGVRGIVSYGIIADSLDVKGQSELRKARNLAERWDGAAGGRLRAAVSPHTIYTCGEDVWREAIELARDCDVPIHTHLAETRQEVAACRAKTGRSPVAYLDGIGAFGVPVLAAHCVHVDSEDVAILAERDVLVAHCPKSNAKLGNGVAPVVEMRSAGIPVGIGTDGAASNNRLDMVEELRAAWTLERGHHEDPGRLAAEDVVRMAIEEARAALGLPDAFMSVGSPADVVLLDTRKSHAWPPHDPISMLAYASAAADVTDVIVNGRMLMKDGELLTIDEERVQSEVERRIRRYKT